MLVLRNINKKAYSIRAPNLCGLKSFFLLNQTTILEIHKKAKVKEYERQIDLLVYKLYNLTDEEIKIVERETLNNFTI